MRVLPSLDICCGETQSYAQSCSHPSQWRPLCRIAARCQLMCDLRTGALIELVGNRTAYAPRHTSARCELLAGARCSVPRSALLTATDALIVSVAFDDIALCIHTHLTVASPQSTSRRTHRILYDRDNRCWIAVRSSCHLEQALSVTSFGRRTRPYLLAQARTFSASSPDPRPSTILAGSDIRQASTRNKKANKACVGWRRKSAPR